MKKILISLVFMATSLWINPQVPLSNNAKISLMTTSPWDGAVYAVYGHTAIFVEDDSLGLDMVFNYGSFDSSHPYFMLNFVRGKTDYILGIQSYEQFVSEYRNKGVSVVKQELNLSPEEKQKLWEALYTNALPENRGYRYNFLYDNCATRVRDMIEKYTLGKIVYLTSEKEQTFRDLLHEYLENYPWMKFGIDLVLGTEADKAIHVQQKMFLPEYLLRSLSTAKVEKNDSVSIPMVKEEITLVKIDNELNNIYEYRFISPNLVAFVLLLFTIIITWIQFRFRAGKLPKIYDTVLFATVGVGGTIIFFLLFFSEHPATNPNWNFVWMNIFSLIFAALFGVKWGQNIVIFYHFINFAVLTAFLACWWFIPQTMPFATLPLAMNLWIRSGANFWLWRKNKNKTQINAEQR